MGSLRDREVACSTSDLQGLNFESCVWRAVSSHLSHHPQEVLLAQFTLYMHKSGLKPDFFHFISDWLRWPSRSIRSLRCTYDAGPAVNQRWVDISRGELLWIALLLLPGKSALFNMAVTEIDLDPKVRKMPITF